MIVPLAETRRLPLTLSRTQLGFVQDGHRFAALVAGVGSGKTFAGAAKAMIQEFCADAAASLGLVVSPTYPMLRDATWRTALEVWAPIVQAAHKSEMRILLKTGHEVLFRSADEPDRLRGPNCSWAWMDEAALCPDGTWPVVIGRLREHGRAGRCWVTTTPAGLNWLYDVFVVRANDDTALFRGHTQANPFVHAAFVDSLKTQYSSEFARQELAGEFVTLGAGVVRREWFRLVDAPPPLEPLKWCRYWDLAASTKESADYTVGCRAALSTDGTVWVADIRRGRWEWPDARRVILDTMAAEPETPVGIEQAGFQLAAVQDVLRDPAAVKTAVRAVTVDRDKLARAQPWIAKAEQGKVALVRGPWLADFLAEVEAFPQGAHDDQVDALSGACQLLGMRVRKWGIAA